MDLATHYTTRWPVRVYEIDAQGHVNNAVYLNYVEQIATEHAESAGFGREWSIQQGGTWVVRRHEVTYKQPAVLGDVLEITTHVGEARGARGVRFTEIRRASDGAEIAQVVTEWVWVRLSDFRPVRVPEAIAAAMRAAPTKDGQQAS